MYGGCFPLIFLFDLLLSFPKFPLFFFLNFYLFYLILELTSLLVCLFESSLKLLIFF
jgi:hypothetical protein